MKNCYYTYGNKCPGLMAKGNKHVSKRCQKCSDFNGNMGKVTVGKKTQEPEWKQNLRRRFEEIE